MSLKAGQKIRVAVLYGGCSCEHEVSLKSAASVIKNLDKNKFVVIPVGIDKQGQWWINDLGQLIATGFIPVKMSLSKKLSFEALANRCDVVFPVLHGAYGEDGTVQGLLEFIGLPYVGANVLASAIGMDKELAKRLVFGDKINVLPFIAFNESQWKTKKLVYQKEIQEKLGYPCFVKPVNAGSSLGITKVKAPADLLKAVSQAFEYDTKILVESAIDARELEVSVLENSKFGEEPLISKVGEIIPKMDKYEFYSYEAKYIDEEGAALVIPAVLQEGQAALITTLASEVFKCLACEGMARVDFFIEKGTQKIYFNEINTIPGFTQISMYPKLWEASGLSYQQLLSSLIELAEARHARVAKLKHRLH